jgi:UDP-N-acetylmuramoyl-tripeptide--D-alanyl-D-alanine ligase
LIAKSANEIILDAYNANPSSMKVALENFIQLENPNKIIIIGDMFELGSESKKEHKEIVVQLENCDAIECYFIGNDFYDAKTIKENFHFFKSFDDFSKAIISENFHNKMILIKGSRGMALERTLQFLP